MAHYICQCGQLIEMGICPHPDGYRLLSESQIDSFDTGKTLESAFFADELVRKGIEVYRCRSCGRYRVTKSKNEHMFLVEEKPGKSPLDCTLTIVGNAHESGNKSTLWWTPNWHDEEFLDPETIAGSHKLIGPANSSEVFALRSSMVTLLRKLGFNVCTQSSVDD